MVNTKKQQIQEAAAVLFRDKGYTATSMRDLAKAVDLKAPSLYNHINSKEEILQDICFDNATKFLEGLAAVRELEGTAYDKVRALLRLHIRIATEDVTSVTAFNDEWRHLSDPHLSEFKKMRKTYEDGFRSIIKQGMEEGEFRELDINIVLYTIFSSVRWVYDWFQQGKKITCEELEQTIASLLMDGMKK